MSQLVNGGCYRAKVILIGMEKLASNAILEGKLTKAGFSNVVVTGLGGHRRAEGIWSGATQNVQLPTQVRELERVA